MINFKKFGYDLLPVTAGVLLALMINSFQENLREKSFIKKVVHTIVQENEKNIVDIQKVVDQQRMVKDSLSFYLQDSLPLVDIIRKCNGVSLPDPLGNGASFLLNTNQTIAEVELLMLLNQINTDIASIDICIHQITDKLYDQFYSVHREDKERLMLMLGDMMNYESLIIKHSKEFNETYARE